MRVASVFLLAGAVVAAAGAGLVVGSLREGPIDVRLEAVTVPAAVEGTYQSRGEDGVLGVCPAPPCGPRTAIDLRFRGLPDVPYEARLDGGGAPEDLGPLQREGDGHTLRWEAAEDHSDKNRIILVMAGRDVATVRLEPSATPAAVAADLPATWNARPAEAHLNEIGAVTVSTVALAELEDSAPDGWVFRARLGDVDLGELDGATLDARVERVRLADHERLVVSLQPAGSAADAGFPVLAASF